MYKEVLRAIVGIEIFPVFSLLVFLAVFVVMLVRVLRMDRARLAACASIPLDDAGIASNGAIHTGQGRSASARRPGGAQL